MLDDDDEIGKEYELTSFVLDLDLEAKQSTMTINECVCERLTSRNVSLTYVTFSFVATFVLRKFAW